MNWHIVSVQLLAFEFRMQASQTSATASEMAAGEEEAANLLLNEALVKARAMWTGLTLQQGLTPVMMTAYLAGVKAMVLGPDDIDAFSPDDHFAALENGWPRVKGESLPGPMAKRGKGAFGLSLRAEGPGAVSLRAALGSGAGGGGGTGLGSSVAASALAREQSALDFETEFMQDFPGSPQHIVAMAVEDCIAQVSQAREAVALSGSLETLQTMESHEFVGEVKYGTEQLSWPPVKYVAKFAKYNLSKLLDAGELTTIAVRVAELSSEMARQDKVRMSNRITRWWAEGAANFVGDDASFLHYLVAYRRFYAGRGLPTLFDESLAVRARNATRLKAGPTCSESYVDKKLAALEVKHERDRAAWEKKMEQAVRGRPSRVGEGETDVQRSARLKNMECHKCGQKGHMARDCPSKGKGKAALLALKLSEQDDE